VSAPTIGGTAAFHLPFSATISGGTPASTHLILDAGIDFTPDPDDVQVSLTGSLNVADFFNISGSFALQESTQTVPLSDGTTVQARVIAMGGEHLTAFAGVNGPAANASAMGFSLSD